MIVRKSDGWFKSDRLLNLIHSVLFSCVFMCIELSFYMFFCYVLILCFTQEYMVLLQEVMAFASEHLILFVIVSVLLVGMLIIYSLGVRDLVKNVETSLFCRDTLVYILPALVIVQGLYYMFGYKAFMVICFMHYFGWWYNLSFVYGKV